MEKTMKRLISLEDVTEELVIEYLRANPVFFQQHEDLLENLYIPHPCGDAISLIERQVTLLRQKNKCLQQEMISTIGIAKDNEQLFEATKRLTLCLLQAKSFQEVVETLEMSIKHDFHADSLRIGLYDLPKKLAGHTLLFPYHEGDNKEIDGILKVCRPTCKRLGREIYKQLFGSKGSKVGSSALLPLAGGKECYGLLAIGSFDKGHFHKDMDTLFLDYIGKIVSQLIPTFI